MNFSPLSRVLACALTICAVVQAAGQAHADGPPAGTYNIRQYTPTRIGDSFAHINYSITSYMILRADGNYEVYEKATKALRSRGTYTFEPGKEGLAGSEGRVRWKSGLNHEMGRGGSYFLKFRDSEYCVVLGGNTVAVLER